jgi:hypothetical protein
MNWTTPPATESKAGAPHRPIEGVSSSSAQPSSIGSIGTTPASSTEPELPPAIAIARVHITNEIDGRLTHAELFTMTLAGETIRLVPFKNWSQLDVHKWTMRGKLPGTPAGLEVGPDYVNLTGETVSIHEPEGCTKLEKLFADWLKLELGSIDLARKARPKPAAAAPDSPAEPQPLHFHVEVDKRGQVHVHCLQGKNTAATIGLTVAGFESLYHQGLMRKPRALHVGALHDWVELDGVYYHFKSGKDDSAALERLLNEHYIPATTHGGAKRIVVSPNEVSPTGFDIQFQAMKGGVLETHRYHLNDESVTLLQDADHCGLLHKRIVIKLIPPQIVFKRKTPDGGEQYLQKGPEHMVRIVEEGEEQHTIDLSQPLNLLRISAAELTAIFNHPAINQYATTENSKPHPPGSTGARTSAGAATVASGPANGRSEFAVHSHVATTRDGHAPNVTPSPAPPSRPNVWLRPFLIKSPLRNDWFASLVYAKMAERFGNSTEGKFGPSTCWSISLSAIEDVADSAFKGIILTEKGSLGFLNNGHFARFCHGVAFVGTERATLEGIGVTLLGVGVDAEERVVFVVNDGFERKFGVPGQTLAHDLATLKKYGVVVLSVTEAVASSDPVETLWTVPAEQVDRSNPEVVESVRPAIN